MEENTQKKKTGLIIGIAVAVVAVICIIVAVAVSALGGGSPKDKADKAFANLMEEFSQYKAYGVDDIGLENVVDYVAENPTHVYLDTSVTLPQADGIGNVSVTLDSIVDLKNEAFDAKLSGGAYGFSLDIGKITYDDMNLYLQSDLLGSDSYKLGLDTFLDDFNNSAWSDLLGMTLPENAEVTILGMKDADLEIYENLVSQFKEDTSNSAQYVSLKDKREFELDSKTVKCSGIEITLDDEVLENSWDALIAGIFDNNENETLVDLLDNMKSIRYDGDVVFDIYLDSKGRIVNMSTPGDITIVNGSNDETLLVSFDLNFIGSERRADVITGNIYMSDSSESVCINVDRNASASDDQYVENVTYTVTSDNDDSLTLSYSKNLNKSDSSFDLSLSVAESDENSFSIAANGNFENVVSGQSCTFNLKNVTLTVGGENLLIVSGQFTYEPSQDTVEIPSNAVDIMSMTEEDIESLIYGIYGNALAVLSGLN